MYRFEPPKDGGELVRRSLHPDRSVDGSPDHSRRRKWCRRIIEWLAHSKSGGYGLIFDSVDGRNTPFRKGITLTAVFGPGQWRRPGAGSHVPAIASSGRRSTTASKASGS
jgi:hypothetical protein